MYCFGHLPALRHPRAVGARPFFNSVVLCALTLPPGVLDTETKHDTMDSQIFAGNHQVRVLSSEALGCPVLLAILEIALRATDTLEEDLS